ncbi:MAG: LamG-like jellyroll fold domain-containing protein [Cyclobacteriaceae bacterium]
MLNRLLTFLFAFLFFHFLVFSQASVAITSPGGSEAVKFGETLDISWENGDLAGNDRFYLYYSNDGGSFTTIDAPYYSQLTNSGSTSTYTWTIPDFGADSASQFRIRVWNQAQNVADTSTEFRVYWEPLVEMVLPDGTEEVKFGETLKISWLNRDMIGNDRFFLYYSNDGGTFTTIDAPYHSQLTNSGDTSSYTWTIPDFSADSASQFRIRVWNQNRNISDTSVNYRVYWEPDVEMVFPDGTEEVKFGETLKISWLNGDMIGNDRFFLYYSNDGGTFTTIDAPYHSQLTNSGDTSSYTWTIPDFSADSSSQFRIRVWNQNRNVSDTSVNYRVYWEPLVNILKPAAGDYVLQGSTQQISWVNNDMIGNDRFFIYYSIDGGTFTTIDAPYHSQLTNSGDTSIYNWTTPTLANSNVSARVRVWNQNRTVSDTTLSFVLCSECPALALYYPNGGEVLGAGKTIDIAWSLAEETTWLATDNILVEYSLDGGTTYESAPIYSGLYSGITDNKVSWVVPNSLTTTALVKVSNTTQSVSDESNSTFTIATAPSIPTDFFALEQANGTVNFSWTDNADNETSYHIQYSSDNINWANYSGSLAAETETYTTGSLGNAAYWWRVAVVSSGLTEYSISRFAGNISPPGNALNFDGTDDKVDANGITTFQNTQNFSIELWASFDELDGFGVLTVCGSSGSQRVDLQFDNAGGRLLAVVANGTSAYGRTSTAMEEGKWYHLVMTYDGTQISNGEKLKVYINGVEDELSFSGSIPASTGSLPSTLRMGTYFDGTFPFSGTLDELRIWDYTLSPEEVSARMLVTLSGNETGLSAYYRFDQSGTSTVLPDRTINNKNGSWTGTSGTNSLPKWVSSGALTDPAPVLSILSPGGGELLYAGDEFTISWQGINFVSSDSIKISFSADNGQEYTLITKGTVADLSGNYSWTVPDSVTSQARIAIANTTKGSSDTTQTFSIQSVTLNILSPNGGEFWEVGTNQIISWVSNGFSSADQIQVSLSTDSGENYAVISEGLNNTYPSNQLNYTVPDSISNTALIKVENTTKGIVDTSDSLFAIGTIERSIAITSPSGGESFAQNSQVSVEFEVEGLLVSDVVTFTLSIDGGLTFPYTLSQAAMSSYPDSAFTWTVSQPISDQALIRVSSAYGLSDTTDAVFSITEAPAAPVFNSLEAEIIGDEYNVTYSLDEPGTVYMVILADGNNIPNATQIKNAGSESLPGQVASADFVYESAEEVVIESGEAVFNRQSLYDVYFTAEDAEGNLNPGLSRPNVFAQFTPLESDSLVVRQMYDAMSGESWSVEAEWIDSPLSTREELTVENGRITGLDFSGKGLTGALPVNITSLDSLNSLNLSSNKVVGLPDMSSLIKLQTLDVSNNSLDFGDLEANAELFSESTQYSPQAKVGQRDSLTRVKGTQYIFSTVIGGEQNTYQWKVDNYNTFPVEFVNVTDANSSSLVVSNLDFANMGTYFVEVMNTQLPGLTIQSEPVQLWATSDLEITVLADDELLAEGAAYALRNRGPGKSYDSIPKDPAGLNLINGVVFFENLLLGQYLIAIRSDPAKYLPTYYKNTYLWEEAELLDFKADLSDTMQMFVIPPPLGPDDGSGTLAGGVESDFDEGDGSGRIDARRKVKRAGCSIRRFTRGGRTDQEDGEFVLMAYVESDDDGRFRIEHIPGGLYRFNIEYPGIPMDPDSYVEFEVGEEGSTNNTIELQATITEDGIFVERTNFLGFGKSAKELISLYPNPADDRLVVKYPDLFNGYIVRMIDSQGKVVSVNRFSNEMNGVFSVDTSVLPQGLYFLNIIDDSKRSMAISLRVVVKH